MPIIYALIAHNDVVLCESTEHEGNFSEISRKVLTKMHTTIKAGDMEAYVFDGHTFNFKGGAEGLIFMCLADEQLGRNLPFGFLDDISQQFIELFPQAKERNSRIDASDKSYAIFQTALSTKMKKYSNTSANGEGGPISTRDRITIGIEEAKAKMLENIEKVSLRGDSLERLHQKTDVLTAHADGFRRITGRFKNEMFWKNIKMKLASTLVVAVIIYVFIIVPLCKFDLSGCTGT